MREAAIFEKIYQEYLRAVSQIDLHRIRDRLGVAVEGDEVVIPFYGFPHRVSGQGIIDDQGRRPSHAVSVILCKYLLLCPDVEPTEFEWVSYKDYRDAAPFVGGFTNNAEKPISRTFSGRLADCQKACRLLNGRPVQTDISADLAVEFEALPRVPILMLFNDRDEDFEAHCSLLFERRAEKYLDMECLAMVGLTLAEWLKQRAHP